MKKIRSAIYTRKSAEEGLETTTTGGAMFPTTTIITKDRIYIPVPKNLEQAFYITGGAKEKSYSLSIVAA